MGHKPIDMYTIWQSQVSNISTYIIKEKKNCEPIKTKQRLLSGQYWQENLLSMIHYWQLALYYI